MSIEQRAHEAAMAHVKNLGMQGSQDFSNAYMAIYNDVTRILNAEKFWEESFSEGFKLRVEKYEKHRRIKMLGRVANGIVSFTLGFATCALMAGLLR